MQDPNRIIHYAPELFTHHDPLSIVSEAFKIVRTNIEFSSIGTQLQTINITSTNQGEGKSSVITNLAITFAQIGRKVLLVDADLRRPMMHRLMGLSNRRGLTNALLSNEPYASFIQQTHLPNLSVLTSGPLPPNPAELLMSVSMNNLIDAIKSDFDLIFLDSPPVGVVTDAAILATKVDGTIFVVRAGNVEKRQLNRAANMLKQVKAHVLGFVFNGVRQDTDEYYYYQNEYTNDGQKSQQCHRRRRKSTTTSSTSNSPVPRTQTVRQVQPINNKGGQEIKYD